MKPQKTEAPRGLMLQVYTDQGYGPSRSHKGGAATHVAGGCATICVVGVRVEEHGWSGTAATEPLPKGAQVFSPSEKCPAFVLVKRGTMGNVLVPVDAPAGMIGPMSGGAFASTSDSRWSSLLDGLYAAVAIHDRFESQALYASNQD